MYTDCLYFILIKPTEGSYLLVTLARNAEAWIKDLHFKTNCKAINIVIFYYIPFNMFKISFEFVRLFRSLLRSVENYKIELKGTHPDLVKST